MKFLAFSRAILFSVLPLLLSAANAGGWGLDQLAADLARTPTGAMRFTELKYLAALKQPLKLDGRVSYTPPDTLEKTVITPQPERFLLRGGVLELQHGTGPVRRVELAQYPLLEAFVGALTATLAGDLARLEQHYSLALSGHEHAWVLRLTPKDPALAARVKSIRVSGAGQRVQEFETTQADGDRSIMFFSLLPSS
ncbi:MAG: LolA-related protein [Nevskiales bacterium]